MIDRFKPVNYEDSAHRYWVGGNDYMSATQVLHHIKPPFDTKERAAYMADRYGQSPEYWVESWKTNTDTALMRGNRIHSNREAFLHARGYTPVNGRVSPVFRPLSEYFRYHEYPDGTYPELKLWDHDWRIAGRADKPTIETIHGTRTMHIEDYKSGKPIRFESSFNEKLLEPLTHLDNCNGNLYTLQLSLYSLMAEYLGFTPGVLRIIHFPHPIEGLGTPKPVPHEVPYMKDEILETLRYLRNKEVLAA